MSSDMILPREPGGAGDHQAGNEKDKGSRGQRQRRHQVPSVEECLAKLASLPGLIAMGAITSAAANAITRALNGIITAHQRAEAAPTGPRLSDEAFAAVLRDNPQLLNQLETLLTDEQIEMLMKHPGGAGDDAA